MNIDELLAGLKEFLVTDKGDNYFTHYGPTPTKHYFNSPEEATEVLAGVLARLKSGDSLDLGEHVFSLDKKLVLKDVDLVHIKGGKFIRQGSKEIHQIFFVQNCQGVTFSNMVFDGKAGIEAPNTQPAEFRVKNPNEVRYPSFIQVIKSDSFTVKDCEFRDLAAKRENSIYDGFIKYLGAYAIRIWDGCTQTKVENCTFYKIGYAGIQDQGFATFVSNCRFIDVQWHGYVSNAGGRGHAHIDGCHFTRQYFASMGYQGGIDVNPPDGEGTERFSLTNSSFYFPYDIPDPKAGSFMVKIQGVEDVFIDNCSFVHGKTHQNGSSNSIRFQRQIGRAKIQNCWMSGSIWHITFNDNWYDLIIDNCQINMENLDVWGAYVMPKSLVVRDSTIKYSKSAFPYYKYSPNPDTFEFLCTNSTFIPDDTTNSYIVSKEFHEHAKIFNFDNTNSLDAQKKFKHSVKG